MAPKPLSKNEKCPCGTGRKYLRCCWAKGFHYLVDDDGGLSRSVPLKPEALQAVKEAEAEFEQRYGRPIGPNDRLFDGIGTEEEIKADVVQAMKKAGIDLAFIYAYEKTGVLLMEDNRHLMPTADVEAFEDALDEYDALYGPDEALDS